MQTSRFLLVLSFAAMLPAALSIIGPSVSPQAATQQNLNLVRDKALEMYNRWRNLDSSCHPNSVFALTYLYMTQALYQHLQNSYFDDNNKMAEFTLHFASLYIQAIDVWSGNATGYQVPQPWTDAFNYAASGYSKAMENLVLGMNTHINRDLAHVVYDLNYGHSQNKDDYDRINDILRVMSPAVSNDLGCRYDSFLNATSGTLLDEVILQMMFSWRQNAWNNGVLMQNAVTNLARQTVETAVLSQTIAASIPFRTYNLNIPTSSSRTEFCESKRDHCDSVIQYNL